MYFVINMDIDTSIDGLGHIQHGRILDLAQFSALLNHTDIIDSVAFSCWDRAADYAETYFPDTIPDAMADITTGELLAELVVRIECTNGIDFISQENIKGLVSRLIDHLDEAEPNPWKYDAPLNPEFLGAQPPRVGEDY